MSEHDNELLSQYLDGELGAPQTLELKKRLLAEPQLRASLEQLQRVDNALRNAFDTPAAEQVPAAVAQMIKPANTGAQPQRKAAWGFAIAASIMASSSMPTTFPSATTMRPSTMTVCTSFAWAW